MNFLIVFASIVNRRHSRDFFENSAKIFRVVVADVEHYFSDVFAARFEAFFGGFDFDALDVFVDGIVGGAFEAALKTAAANGEFVG